LNWIIQRFELAAGIEPFYPKPESAARQPIGIERLLRIHSLRYQFDLSDLAEKRSHVHTMSGLPAIA
jgi:hypothetical protein